MSLVPDHNDRQWYAVQYFTGRFVPGEHNRDGWYVVRRCPCHFGESVTLSYPDKQWAEDVLEVILSVTPT